MEYLPSLINRLLDPKTIGDVSSHPMDGEIAELGSGKTYDVLYAIGTGEKYPEDYNIVEQLVALSPVIVWASATPGQSLCANAQYPEYWAEKFAAVGYNVIDVVRPLIWDREDVPVGIKQNCLLFVKSGMDYPILDEARKWTDPAWLTMIYPNTTLPPVRKGISLLAIVRDEESRITEMLDSLFDVDTGEYLVDEVVLIDQQSTDNTVEIVRDWCATAFIPFCYRIYPEVGYSEMSRPLGIGLSRCSWILHLDADESLSPELRKSLREYTNSNLIGGWRIRRRNTVISPKGRLITESIEDQHIRLIKKIRSMPQSRKIHDLLRVSGPTGLITHYLNHTRSAKEALEDGDRCEGVEHWDKQAQLTATIRDFLQLEDLSTE